MLVLSDACLESECFLYVELRCEISDRVALMAVKEAAEMAIMKNEVFISS